MPHKQPEEHITQAVSAVGEALRLLARPDEDALARSNEALNGARACLGLAAGSGPASRAGALDQLYRLRRSLTTARALVEHGEAFWEGWARLRSALTAGYTPAGAPAVAPPGGRLSVEG